MPEEDLIGWAVAIVLFCGGGGLWALISPGTFGAGSYYRGHGGPRDPESPSGRALIRVGGLGSLVIAAVPAWFLVSISPWWA